MSMIPERHLCIECDGYIGSAHPALACTCAKTEPPLPNDPDERMRLLRGCSLAEYAATTQRYLERGHA
jgi:hypothetical protein